MCTQEQGVDQRFVNEKVRFMTEHYQTGILVYESSYICFEFSVADNCTNGIIMLRGRYHNISSTIVTNSKIGGIILYATHRTRIMNCNLINNTNFGIVIISSTSTSLMNVSNQGDRILIDSSTSTSLINVSVEHNQFGIEIDSSTSTSLIKFNVSVEHNQQDGILIDSSTSTSLINVSVEHNQFGIEIDSSTSTSLINVSVEHNQQDGILIDSSTSTSLMNVSTKHNQVYGIEIHRSISTSLMNVSAEKDGIHIYGSHIVSLYDVISSNNSDGLYLEKSDNITVIRAIAYHNNNHGISLTLTNNISITAGTLNSIVVYSTASLQVSFCLFSEVHVDVSTTITNTDPDSLPAMTLL